MTMFPVLQGLRGAAALAVVACHIYPGFWVGQAGVDVFFVISGFIMVHSSRPLVENPAAPTIFVTKRLIRIVPLYWATTGFLLIEILIRHGSKSSGISIDAVLASFLFIPFPYPGSDGGIAPILAVGWTLNYEMFFYGLFAMALALPARLSLMSIVVGLPVLSLIGFAFSSRLPIAIAYWTSPVILEFWLGVCVAMARTATTPRLSMSILVVAACIITIVGIFGSPALFDSWPRIAMVGLPAALLIYAAVSWKVVPFESGLMIAGDLSYALYLTHTLTLSAAAILFTGAWANKSAGNALEFLFLVVICVLVAGAVHALFERPITRFLRNRYSTARAPLPEAASPTA